MSPGPFGTDAPIIEQKIKALLAVVPEAKRRIVRLRGPQTAQAAITLPVLKLDLLRKSFQGDYYLPEKKIMEHYRSGCVAPHLRDLKEDVFDVPTSSFILRQLIPGGKMPQDNQWGELDLRIAYLAEKNLFHGLEKYELETNVVTGLVYTATKMYVDSKTFFDGLDNELPVKDAFLACARVVLTAYNELKGEGKGQTTFTSQVVASTLVDVMDSKVRVKYEEKYLIPGTDGEEDRTDGQTTHRTQDQRGSDVPEKEVKIVRIRDDRDRLLLLKEYHALYKQGNDLKKAPKPFPWDILAGRMPGFTKNDCILYYNENKAEFGDQVLPDIPYDSNTAPVRLARKRTPEGELEVENAE